MAILIGLVVCLSIFVVLLYRQVSRLEARIERLHRFVGEINRSLLDLTVKINRIKTISEDRLPVPSWISAMIVKQVAELGFVRSELTDLHKTNDSFSKFCDLISEDVRRLTVRMDRVVRASTDVTRGARRPFRARQGLRTSSKVSGNRGP